MYLLCLLLCLVITLLVDSLSRGLKNEEPPNRNVFKPDGEGYSCNLIKGCSNYGELVEVKRKLRPEEGKKSKFAHDSGVVVENATGSDYKLPQSQCSSVKRLDEIYSALHDIAEKYADTVKLSVLGKTYNSNPIYAVEIHSGHAFHYAIIVVDFGLHPREWATAAAALYLVERLLEEGGQMTENIQWFIIPMANPDGYSYATTVNNLWRKNRRPIKGTKCYGVDLNRNFGVGWETSLSLDPCREDYSGSEPFSEIETQVIRDYVNTIGPQYVDAYISVNSCLQSIFVPYEYTEAEPAAKLLKNLKLVGKKMAEAMYSIRGTTYFVGPNSKYFRGGGIVSDFMFEHFHIPLVYRLELGDLRYFTAANYQQCYHPQEPGLMENLTRECHAGLRALAIHLIDSRKPYSYKLLTQSSAARQIVNATAAPGGCRRVEFEPLLAFLTVMQTYQSVI